MKDNIFYELSLFIESLSKEQLQKLKEFVLQYNNDNIPKIAKPKIK